MSEKELRRIERNAQTAELLLASLVGLVILGALIAASEWLA
jgi:hypothetical protein